MHAQRPCRAPRAIALLAAFFFPGAVLAQKAQTWIEIRSPHFTVVTNGSEKDGRNLAEQFEAFRSAFAQSFPRARVDLGKPLIILR